MSRLKVDLEISVKTTGYEVIDGDEDTLPTQEEIDEIINQHQKEVYEEIYNDLEKTFGLNTLSEKEVIVNIKVKIVE